ncbi:MAG: rubredoxin [Christensenellales bacterium]
MGIYVCQVCGYVYDPAKGSSETGIASGTAWAEVSEDWECPLCGAGKSEFAAREPAAGAQLRAVVVNESALADGELSALEKSTVCANLARGCEKQHKSVEAGLFRQLADYFLASAPVAQEAAYNQLTALLEQDLEGSYPDANAVSAREHDRGALRALTWGVKVSRMQKSLLTRYEKVGEAAFEGSDFYVCTACGFIYAGNNPPELCSVCKVPGWKFEKVKGGSERV